MILVIIINYEKRISYWQILLAIEEDVEKGDVTTNSLVPESTLAVAEMTAKADGVISGIDIARMVFERFDKNIRWSPSTTEGGRVKKGDAIVRVEGSYRALLTGERTALNILQRMSGIATATSNYVKELEGTATQLLDTRKTAPGMRILDKIAVRAGGGTNHRMGLYDLALIKDNHIKVAGGITEAVKEVRAYAPGIKVEVEVTTLEETKEAVTAGADIIMLDNMSNEMMEAAVKLIDGRAKTEASGNMTIGRLKGVAATGVDYISVGALTHSVTALDISMNIVPHK
ncbi:carboxylating nicotinate-nucleotide diphosphorylase [Bacteroidales bacterium]